MDIGYNWNGRMVYDLLKAGSCLLIHNSHTNNVTASFLQSAYLFYSSLHITGVCIGHGLYGNGGSAPYLYFSHFNRSGGISHKNTPFLRKKIQSRYILNC